MSSTTSGPSGYGYALAHREMGFETFKKSKQLIMKIISELGYKNNEVYVVFQSGMFSGCYMSESSAIEFVQSLNTKFP